MGPRLNQRLAGMERKLSKGNEISKDQHFLMGKKQNLKQINLSKKKLTTYMRSIIHKNKLNTINIEKGKRK